MTQILNSPLLAQLGGVSHAFSASSDDTPRDLIRVRQVHGPDLVTLTTGEPDPAGRREADGLVSRDRAVAVVTADCAPILLAAADGRTVAAIHAGWRGLAAGIVERATEALKAAAGKVGADSAPVAAVGPAAGGCCYEVGPEVLEALGLTAGNPAVIPTRAGRARLDLRAVVLDRLAAAGIPFEQAEIVGPCTICSTAWPSFRRRGNEAGRMVSWIRPREYVLPRNF